MASYKNSSVLVKRICIPSAEIEWSMMRNPISVGSPDEKSPEILPGYGRPRLDIYPIVLGHME